MKFYYTTEGEISPLKDSDPHEGCVLAEMADNEARNFVEAMNGTGRKVWSLVEVRKEIVTLED